MCNTECIYYFYVKTFLCSLKKISCFFNQINPHFKFIILSFWTVFPINHWNVDFCLFVLNIKGIIYFHLIINNDYPRYIFKKYLIAIYILKDTSISLESFKYKTQIKVQFQVQYVVWKSKLCQQVLKNLDKFRKLHLLTDSAKIKLYVRLEQWW